MSALAFTIVALVLSGPVPAMLARATWPTRAPRAAIVLWQSIALAAVLSAFSAGIAIASRLFVPGPDGRPTATITSEIEALGWPLWTALRHCLRGHPGDRRPADLRSRAGRHRHPAPTGTPPDGRRPGRQVAGQSTLRILDVAQPLAYCLPGVRSRVVVSEGALNALADNEMAAILSHERAHLRARHDLVLEMFTAVHAAFPRFVRSAHALRRRPAAHRTARRRRGRARRGSHPLGSRPCRLRVRTHPVGRACRRRSDHGAAGAPPRRAAQQSRPCGGRLPRRGRGARGAHSRARGAMVDRTSSTVHRIIISAVKAAVPQQKTKGCPNELVCKL